MLQACCTRNTPTIRYFLHFKFLWAILARRAFKALYHATNHSSGPGGDQGGWEDQPTAGVGWARPSVYVTTLGSGPSQHLRRPRCRRVHGWGRPKWSRHDVCRPFLRESGIGLATPATRTAPLSRDSLLDAMRGFGSLRREDAQPPVAPRREGDTRQQKVLRTSHARYSAHQSAADLGSTCYGRALLRQFGCSRPILAA